MTFEYGISFDHLYLYLNVMIFGRWDSGQLLLIGAFHPIGG